MPEHLVHRLEGERAETLGAVVVMASTSRCPAEASTVPPPGGARDAQTDVAKALDHFIGALDGTRP
ncbi:hypothetical protein [Streptomyces sp. NPDC050585]|uniref:hypothetical protein n=1 Tax=Streptomyces sp. NPDC050585 TaxID=3365632 RepID=UPI003790B7E5